ncbi:hypothetical protein [Paenibacillus sp. WC2504]|uniref:hypothetical protein n=1 Tax=Paenibacillus sp. WC2504 TaxID=3461403 RepID=UPI004045BB61
MLKLVGIIIFIFITGLFVTSYFIFSRKLKKKEEFFLFMIILNVIIDATWIMTEEMKLIVISQKIPEYIAFLLYRSVTIPFVVLFFLRLLLAYRTPFSKVLVGSGYVILLLLLESLLLHYKIITYINWFLSYSSICYIILMVIAYVMLAWYRHTFGQKKDGVLNESDSI